MAEAFPDYGRAANGETFRRFLAGLDPALQAKCHEQGATDVEEALTVAGRCEWARQALRASTPGLPYSSPQPAVVAALNPASPSVLDCNANATEKLVHAIERLTSRMDNLQTEVRDLRVWRSWLPFSWGSSAEPGGTQRAAARLSLRLWRVRMQVHLQGLPDGRQHERPVSAAQTSGRIR